MRALSVGIFVFGIGVGGAAAAEPKVFSLGAPVSAVVAKILVADGAHVAAGQPLVALDCRPQQARIQAAAGKLAAADANYRRVKNGPRPEEVAIGEAGVGQAKARADEAADAFARARALTMGVTITRAQFLEAQRDARMSAAALNDAQKQLALLHAGSRQEDIDEAKGLLDRAEGKLAVEKAKLDQCTVTAPAAGVVEILVSPGQLMSLYAPAPVARLTPDAK